MIRASSARTAKQVPTTKNGPTAAGTASGQEHKSSGGTMPDNDSTAARADAQEPQPGVDGWDNALSRLLVDEAEPRVLWQQDDPGAFMIGLYRTPAGRLEVELDVQQLDLEGAARLHSALSVLFATVALRGIASKP